MLTSDSVLYGKSQIEKLQSHCATAIRWTQMWLEIFLHVRTKGFSEPHMVWPDLLHIYTHLPEIKLPMSTERLILQTCIFHFETDMNTN